MFFSLRLFSPRTVNLLACTIQLGCSPSADNTPDAPASSASQAAPASSSTGTGSVALEDFVTAFVRASCELTLSCRFGSDQDVRLAYGTVEHCEETLSHWVTPDLVARVEAVQDGRFQYDAQAARRCLDKLPGLCGMTEPEEAYDAIDVFCTDVFDGNVAPGGKCDADVQCQGDAFCTDRFGSCAGICQLRRQLGDACDDSTEPCSAASEEWPLICQSGKCVSLSVTTNHGLGDSCGFIEASASYQLCSPDLACTENETDLSCSQRIPVGATCADESDVCDEGALCLKSNPDSDARRCEAVKIQRTAGAPCDTPFSACDPYGRLRCDESTGTCVLLGDGALGSACTPDSWYDCNAGLYCAASDADNTDEVATGTCQTSLALNSPCDLDNQCESLHCDTSGSAAGVCVSHFCTETQ